MRVVEIEKNAGWLLRTLFNKDDDIVIIDWKSYFENLDLYSIIYEPRTKTNNIIIANKPSLVDYDFIQPNKEDILFRNRLNIFNLLKKHGIKTPKTSLLKIDSSLLHIHNELTYSGLIEHDSIVIRPLTTARSLGNLVIEVYKIEALKDLRRDVTVFLKKKELKSVIPMTNEISGFIDSRFKHHMIDRPNLSNRGFWITDDEMYRLEDVLFSTRYYPQVAQEIIKVSKEFRFYYHFGMDNLRDMVCILRRGFSLNPDKEKVSEICITDFYSETGIYHTEVNDTLIKMVAMFKELKLLAASIDLYITDTGEVGVFEFSPEFSFDGVPMKKITEYKEGLKKALIEYIK